MPMQNPPHPGHSIKDACLDHLGLSMTEGAKVIGVAPHTLSRVIDGQAGISREMAILLEKAGWSNADHWLRVQAAYDLAQARRHKGDIEVSRYEPQAALESRSSRVPQRFLRQTQTAIRDGSGILSMPP